jgi:hypothetical protein
VAIDLGVLKGEYERVPVPEFNADAQGSQLCDRLLRPAAILGADLVSPLIPVHRSKISLRRGFSCDIAYSESPAASRAFDWLIYSFQWTIRPSLNLARCAYLPSDTSMPVMRPRMRWSRSATT